MKSFACLLLVVFVAAATTRAAERTWTDNSGRFTVRAELLSVVDGKVTLKRSDGSTVTLPVSSLSKDDQEFLRSKKDVKKEIPKSDVEKIQGYWRLTGVWFAGERNPGIPVQTWRFSKGIMEGVEVVDGVIRSMGASNFKLDPSKTSKQLDIVSPKTRFPENTALFTYLLEGDSLVLNCLFAQDGKSRPKTVTKESEKDDDFFVYVLVRVNPADLKKQSSKPKAPKKKPEEIKVLPGSDLDKIQGIWLIKNAWLDGKKHTDKFSNAMRFSKDTFQAGAYVKGEFHVGEFARKFKLDETKTPKRFDKYGVYSLDGDKLILCFSNAGLKIPKSIPKEGKKGDNLQIYVLTRVKDKQPHQQNADEPINPPNVKGTLNK